MVVDINSEISLKTIQNMSDGQQWIRRSVKPSIDAE